MRVMEFLLALLLVLPSFSPAWGGDDQIRPLQVQLTIENKNWADLAYLRGQRSPNRMPPLPFDRDEPVTSGVPLPLEADITDPSRLAVVDVKGRPVPAQVQVLSRWYGSPNDPAKPLRWVLLDFQARVLGDGTASYSLREGPPVGSWGRPLARESSTHIVVDTGPMAFSIRKTGPFVLFDTLSVDGKDFLGPRNADGLVLQALGADYASAKGRSQASVESNGPLKAVVKVRGSFSSDSGPLLPRGTGVDPRSARFVGTQPVAYTVWITAYRGKRLVKISARVENNDRGFNGGGYIPEKGHTSYDVEVDAFRLVLTTGLVSTRTVELEGVRETSSADYALIQDHDDGGGPSGRFGGRGIPLYSEDGKFRFVVRRGETVIGSGERALGVFGVFDGERRLALGSRYFWQNFPVGISLHGSQVWYEFWPRLGRPYRLRGGLHKTWEILLSFEDGPPLQEYHPIASPLFAQARASWYVRARGLDYSAPRGGFTPATPALEEALRWYEDKSDNFFDQTKDASRESRVWASLFWFRENRPDFFAENFGHGTAQNWYGWHRFGDNLWSYGASGNVYEYDHGFFVAFMRSNLLEHLALGYEYVQHFADADIIHGVGFGDENDRLARGAQRYEKDAHNEFLGPGDYLTGALWGTSHTWIKGLYYAYLLFGETRFRDAALLVGEHKRYNWMVFYKAKDPSVRRVGTAETRQEARAIDIFQTLFHLTGDAEWPEAAWLLFEKGLLYKEQHGEPGQPARPGQTAYVKAALGSDGWSFYEAVLSRPLIAFHDTLAANGQRKRAETIGAFLERHGRFFLDVFNLFTDPPQTSKGPLYSPTRLPEGFRWGERYTRGSYYYGFLTADLFAFVYKRTRDPAWLERARRSYEDYALYHYPGPPEGFTRPRRSNAVYFHPLGTWEKTYNLQMVFGHYYLSVEYELVGGMRIPSGDRW